MLPAGVKSIVDELAKRDGVVAVILFGSQARGDAYPFSDYDLAVFLRKGAKKTGIESLSGKGIDVVIFNDLPPYMRYQILGEGKILLLKDRKTFDAIQRETVLEYLDVAHMYRRYGVTV